MIFIDKTVHQAVVNQLVNNFIDSRWDVALNKYTEISYGSFAFRNGLKAQLKSQLLIEQNNLCCYCMREIANDSSTTLEHIVPKSTITQAGLALYTHHALINTGVCLQAVFESSAIPLNKPPYPLEIAYENLAASCKGDFPGVQTFFICNHRRKSSYVEALFLIPNISTEISYKKAGLLVPADSTYDSTINTLNLNHDSLEHIRQVWFHISVESLVSIESARNDAERNNILTPNLVGLPNTRRTLLINTFKSEAFWNILLKYKWFYQYYRDTYPPHERR